MTPTKVTMLALSGGDRFVAYNAWLSTGKHKQAYECPEEEVYKLIHFLMRGARKSKPARRPHASPFGHPHFTVLVENAPIFVAHQWERHRTQNFSEGSFRYGTLREGAPVGDVMYMPAREDVRRQVGFPGDYEFPPLLDESEHAVDQGLEEIYLAYEQALSSYNTLLDLDWAPELARTVLPVGTLTTFTATASLRNWLNFLVLRATEADEELSSQAQLEIRQPADDVEKIIVQHYPITHAAWTALGRPVL